MTTATTLTRAILSTTKRANKHAGESPEDRFKRIASLRTQKALEALRRLRQAANRKQYSYTGEQVEKIMSALSGELSALASAFAGTGSAGSGGFTV